MLRLLRANADVRWLFLAQVVSFTGDWFAFVAIANMVIEGTGSPFLVSLAYVAFTLPAFLISPIAGTAVDRFDRRRLLIVVSVLQTAAAFALLTASVDRVWPLFVFQGCISALAAFVKPAIEAGVPNVVRSAEELQVANALFGATWGVMLAVGAALGGLISEVFGPSAAFVANGVSFVLALLLVALVRRPLQASEQGQRPRLRPIADIVEVSRHARRDPVLLALIASKATFGIGAAVVSQLPVLVTKVYGWGGGGTGMMLAARGVGSGVGPLIASRFVSGNLAKVLRVCGAAGLAFTVCYLGIAVAPTIYLAGALVLIGHLGAGAQWTLSTFGLQLRTPDHILGRVLAGDFALVTLVMSAAGLAAGIVAEVVSVRATIAIFAGISAVVGSIYMVWLRKVTVVATAVAADLA